MEVEAQNFLHSLKVEMGHSLWRRDQPDLKYTGFAECMCWSHTHNNVEPKEKKTYMKA